MIDLEGKIFLAADGPWIYPIVPQWTEVIITIAAKNYFALLGFLEEVTAPEQGTSAVLHPVFDFEVVSELKEFEQIALFGGRKPTGYLVLEAIKTDGEMRGTPRDITL